MLAAVGQFCATALWKQNLEACRTLIMGAAQKGAKVSSKIIWSWIYMTQLINYVHQYLTDILMIDYIRYCFYPRHPILLQKPRVKVVNLL